MCTAFSTRQFINNTKGDPKIVRAEKKKGRVHLAWMCKLYLNQMSEGRSFLHVIRPMRLRGMSHA